MLMIITYCALFSSAVVSLTILLRICFALRTFKRSPSRSESHDDKQLPTVSVCIPARNESNAMTQCLERVIASTYPKLEIIVFDDQSGDNTSFLIKSFAHAGVRFIEGSQLPEGWLGKNFAEYNLFKEASGEYILYLDVDTHIAPETIHTLVDQIISDNVTMLSVLPARNDNVRMSVLFATLRYFWVLMFHRTNRPAVASSLWLISRAYIENDMNGLENVKDAIEPEATIAARLMHTNGYRFYVNDKELGVSYEKKWLSQCETSVRLLFPFVGGTGLSFIGVMTALLLLVYPAVLLTVSVYMAHWSYETTLALISILLFALSYVLYLSVTWAKGRMLGLVMLPIVLIQEVALLIISAYKYSTKTVTWKGRPVYTSAKTLRMR